MNCKKCQTPNEENAQFCKNCGTNLHFCPEINNNNSKKADILILIFLIATVVIGINQFAITKFVDHWWEEGLYKYCYAGLSIIRAFLYVLLGLAIKNKVAKIIGIILASLWATYLIYDNIFWLLR